VSSQGSSILTRRRFLTIVSGGVAAGAVGLLLSNRILEVVGYSQADFRKFSGLENQWVMVIDLAKCQGCRDCTVACNEGHFVPEGQEWIPVLTVQDELGAEFFLPRPCMQCENPPCVKVCPVDATYTRDDGVVLIDHERCIGCRYCMAACPYAARSFVWVEPTHTPEELSHEYSPEAPWPHRVGTVTKCDFCVHEVREGRLPHCARACCVQAIYFGDIREDAVSNGEETLPLAETLREKGGFRFKEELGTLPRVWYLPPRRS
jgi:Fe-S-cluster-containing dehydrogenase component